MELMSKEARVYFMYAVLFIAGAIVGFFIAKNQLPSLTGQPDSLTNDLYSSQTATIRGEITGMNGNNLSVTNLNSNTSGIIIASERVVITKPGEQPSSDLATLEMNKEVLINLELINGQYQAVSIQYVTPAPSLPPNPSIKPTTLPTPKPN